MSGPWGGVGPTLPPHTHALARNWWALALRGVFALVFGLIAILLPGVALATLVLVYGIYALADGIAGLVGAVRAATHHGRWGALLGEGVVNLLAGAAALLLPGLTLVVFVILLAAWAVVSGVLMLAAAFRLHGAHGRFLLGFGGLASVLLGVLLFLLPVAGAAVVAVWLGIYALVFGIALIAFALRLRRSAGAVPGPA